MQPADRVTVIACGALAHELAMLRRALGEAAFKISCLPPELHNTPALIPAAVATAVREAQQAGERVFVAYADCGTGGLLDGVLAELKVERLPGAHCYEFFAGSQAFAQLADAEPGTFYLTDFLVWHFERLVVQSLGIDRHPELIGEYFKHYRRVVYLRQAESQQWTQKASEIAARLGLEFVERVTGLGDLSVKLQQVLGRDNLSLVIEGAARPEQPARLVG
jgi:Protein of unknown function (DUF1638)